jgi:hypothetical protein
MNVHNSHIINSGTTKNVVRNGQGMWHAGEKKAFDRLAADLRERDHSKDLR